MRESDVHSLVGVWIRAPPGFGGKLGLLQMEQEMFMFSKSQFSVLLAGVLVASAPVAVATATTIVSDQFNGSGAYNSSIWTLSAPTGNPNGSAAVALDGNGNLLMNVPAGSDAWINNRSYAPFLTQTVPSGEPANYEIDTEVTMNNGTANPDTIGGLIVLGSSNNSTYPFTVSLGLQNGSTFGAGNTSIQFQVPGNTLDFFNVPSTTPTGGPVYLQLVRTGTTWTANYSLTSPSTWTTLGSITDSNLNGQNSTSVGLFAKAWTQQNSAIASFAYFNSSPVPEPASVGMFAAGAVGLLLLKKRKFA